MNDNNKKYWCIDCGEYSMELVNEDFSDYKVFITLECPVCGEVETDSVYLDEYQYYG